MDTLLILTILIVFFALAFDFINGFHDTANAIATVCFNKGLEAKACHYFSSHHELCRCYDVYRSCENNYKRYCDPFTLQNGSYVILAALLAAIAWNLITWYYGIPCSSSHALIGSIAGAAIAAAGFGVIKWEGFLKILQGLIISPLLAFVIGFIVYSIFKVVFKNNNLTKTNRNFRTIQIATAPSIVYTRNE